MLQEHRSRPLWARELKQKFLNHKLLFLMVAPLVGAWIETCARVYNHRILGVAPLVGAWIETYDLRTADAKGKSRPLWARELKQVHKTYQYQKQKSRPLWARELKPLWYLNVISNVAGRAPCGRVNWNKVNNSVRSDVGQSRPLWARELKHA